MNAGPEQEALIDALGSQTGAEGANRLRLLIDNGRLKLAPAIAAEYEALRAEAEATIDVEITTASPAAPEQLAALVDAIARRLARKLNAGQVFINNYGAGGGIELPFGGTGKSGHGR